MRREATVTLLSCGETFALGLGPVVPRAGWLEGLRVTAHPAGLLLHLGERIDTHLPSLRGARIDPSATEALRPRYGGEMSDGARAWLRGFGVTSVGRFNEYCVSGRVSELIQVAEGFHEKWIGHIADTVAARRGEVKVIVIAGPSSSGKTTFIKRLTVQLLVNGTRPQSVSLDDYYVDRVLTPKDESGDYDFEAFEALDGALLQSHVARVLAGERVKMARYDFLAGKSSPDGGKELSLAAEGDVLLFEGIHGLNPALLGAAVAPQSIFRIFVHPATTLPFDHLGMFAPDDARLIRRIVRDRHQRDYTAAETIQRWPSVRRGELCHIYPNLVNADVVFDSSLVYEMSVLKTYAERYLLEVPPSHPAFTTAFRLRNLIDQFVAIYPDHVPPTSVLREFIGGSGFEY
jgi:uridine kinase